VEDGVSEDIPPGLLAVPLTHTLKICCRGRVGDHLEWLGTVRFGLAADGHAVLAGNGVRHQYRCRAEGCGVSYVAGGELYRKRSRRGIPTDLQRLCAGLAAEDPTERLLTFDISKR
jgi:hypothetical protein